MSRGEWPDPADWRDPAERPTAAAHPADRRVREALRRRLGIAVARGAQEAMGERMRAGHPQRHDLEYAFETARIQLEVLMRGLGPLAALDERELTGRW